MPITDAMAVAMPITDAMAVYIPITDAMAVADAVTFANAVLCAVAVFPVTDMLFKQFLTKISHIYSNLYEI